LLVSSLAVADQALLLIGALSSHATGCSLIVETGLLAVFSQMFLSAALSDTTLQLAILSNIARHRAEIPQVSLVTSCLMQDLKYTNTHKAQILATLGTLISAAPTCVQEYDLRNSIMPLIGPKQAPAVVVCALRLFAQCDAAPLKGLYKPLCQKVYELLTDGGMLFPEVIFATVELVSALSVSFDLTEFLCAVQFVAFVKAARDEMGKDFGDVADKIGDLLMFLEVAEGRGA
jgi:hypothetical protein